MMKDTNNILKQINKHSRQQHLCLWCEHFSIQQIKQDQLAETNKKQDSYNTTAVRGQLFCSWSDIDA